MGREARYARIRELQRARAGFVSRILALAADVGFMFLIGLVAVGFVALVRWLITPRNFLVPKVGGALAIAIALLFAVGYFTYGWATTGRTLGEQLFGLRTVREDGTIMSVGRAVARAALTVFFLIGTLWILVSKKNASVQDLICRTAVVYDWWHVPEGNRTKGPSPHDTMRPTP